MDAMNRKSEVSSIGRTATTTLRQPSCVASFIPNLTPHLKAKGRLGNAPNDAAVEQAVLGDRECHVGLELVERFVHNNGRRGFGFRPQQAVCAAFPAFGASSSWGMVL